MSEYVEPHIRVVWEDYPENHTQEAIKRVKMYFQKKYNTRYVHVITSPIVNFDATKLTSLDITENISDFQYQKKLMLDFIKENNIKIDINKIHSLDDKVNLKVEEEIVNKIKYNKWYIRNIRFSNFLSFGQDNYIDFERLGGITVVESNPKNFGGKSSATIDLLLFLFFNKTTKTKTNIEIFNRYSSDNVVEVKGELTIDGADYVIERKLSRKKSRSGDYKVTNELNFYKYENGEVINLEGEQRRETEQFITAAIGTETDFLSTILTTGYNLEELIDSKPTARGQILTKFLGLENLKIKEETAKKMYNEWSRTLHSNTNSRITLEENIREYKMSIEESEVEMVKLKDEIEANEKLLKEMETKKEKVLSSKNNDIDMELIKTNPSLLRKEIEDIETDIKNKKVKCDEINVVEPTEYYSEIDHKKITNDINDIIVEGKSVASEIKRQEDLVVQLEEGSICPTCKRPLDDVNHDDEIARIKQKISDLKGERKKIGVKYKELEAINEDFNKSKKEFEDYEKNKVLKSRYELEVEQKKHEHTIKSERLNKYDSNKQKMEQNQRIEAEILALNTKIETAKAEVKHNDALILKHSNNITLMSNSITKCNESIVIIKREEEYQSIFKVYLSIFGKNGVSKEIVKNIVPLLNEELRNLLSDSSEFTVELRINERHEIQFMMIDNETRVEKPLESGSGYEKTIASLALRCVLTKVSSLPKPNIVVMDEVFGKIADENLELVGEFFKKIKNYFDHIMVISHNPLIRNWSDNVIMVKKEENISSVDFIKVNFL